MKITIFGTNCISDIDPSNIAPEDCCQILQNYRDAVEDQILKQYPEATIIWQTASPCGGEFAVRGAGLDEERIAEDCSRISEAVFEKGEFWECEPS